MHATCTFFSKGIFNVFDSPKLKSFIQTQSQYNKTKFTGYRDNSTQLDNISITIAK